MRLSYFLLLVAVMFVACRANFTDAEDIATFRDQKAKTEVADDGTHRHLRGSKKPTTGGTIAVSEERLALPGVKNALSKLQSMFSKNPDLAKALKQKKTGRINLKDPAVRKKLLGMGALAAFVIGTPLLVVAASGAWKADRS
ncbi:uncharacterized protein KRP23_8944 [Phytophthora ramorum]|uniref:uncharacterized protein n=1 Tax=Phytophthora ramorum TaxID=164328 RepID=UPI0030A1EF99|nr:hypothetical protein KRP23_8944 [Phytophthora ramorum]KAH7500175.1 hypothetical protein KRP22_9433 [Phytophthora ramorum]